MFKAIDRLINRRGPAQRLIVSSRQGVTFFREDIESGAFAWKNVRRIAAYKDDLLTTDLIRVEFEAENGLVYRTDEEVPGFEKLCADMVAVIATIDPNWFVMVAQPAFAKNVTVLYKDTD